MEENEKKEQKGMSDAARRRAEDRQKARELRKQAMEEAAAEDKRRAEELLKEKTQDPSKPENEKSKGKTSGIEAKGTKSEPAAPKSKTIDIGALLAEDPKKAVKVILEEKGVEKEDLDAYAYGDAINAELERLMDAFGGKEEYRKHIAEPTTRKSTEAEKRLSNKLSRTDVSEITVGARKYYKAENLKKEEKKKEEKEKKLLPIPGVLLRLINHICFFIGLWKLCEKRYDDLFVLIGVALVAYGVGSLGYRWKTKMKMGKNVPLYAFLLEGVSYAAVIFVLNKIREWLWYSWISFEFYRVLLVPIVGAFVAFAVVAYWWIVETCEVKDKGKIKIYGK